MNRRDAETLSDHGCHMRRRRLPCILFSLCLCVSAVNLSCGSKPSDLRSLVPADTLIYLETNDLGGAIQPIIDSKAFTEAAKYKPDLSPIKGVQLAVAVTGFEMAEEKVSDEQSVGSIRPHFVAIADTHAWNWQAVGFAEKKLGSFVAKIYDSEPDLVRSNKFGGNYFAWSAKDGRKAYALVVDGLIYFGNDESSIEKCLAVRRGESDSIAKTGKVPAAEPGTLASGYVGPDGIAQLANVIGLKLAAEVSDESEVQRAIADVVPQLLRSSVTQIVWTSRKADGGVEDQYSLELTSQTYSLLRSTIRPAERIDESKAIAFIPVEAVSVTRYKLSDPLAAWQGLTAAGTKVVEPQYAKILTIVAQSLLAEYGITEATLEGVTSDIWSVRLDPEGEQSALVTSFSPGVDIERLNRSLVDIDLSKPAGMGLRGPLWISEDGETTVLLSEGAQETRILAIGDPEAVTKCQRATSNYLYNEGNQQNRTFYDAFAETNRSMVVTYGSESAEGIVNVLGAKATNADLSSRYLSQTNLRASGLERTTVSDFGLIGSIMAQLAQE